MPSKTLSERIILVTGASRGIGYEAALAAAKRGAVVVVLARTASGLEALDDEVRAIGGRAVLIPADLGQEEAVARLPAALEERFGRIDGLVLNAGLLGPMTQIADMPMKEWHRTFTINLYANVALLKLLHPLLSASDGARVVGIGSGAALKHKPFWGAYAASKAAFENVVLTYAEENAKSGIAANILDPGPTATDMRAEAMPGEDPATITPPKAIGEKVADMLEPGFSQSGERVAYPRPEGK